MVTVGVNSRTFTVDEPDGAVHTAMQHTQHLSARGDVSVRLYGHHSLADKFKGASVDNSYIPFQSKVYGLMWERTLLPLHARTQDIDILYCPNANAPLHKTTAYKTVVLLFHLMPEMGQSAVERTYRRAVLPRTTSAADAVVTISEYSKQRIQEALDVPESKIHVAHSGVDPLFLNSDQGEQMDLPENYILYVGSISERKNVPRLVDAYKQLKESKDIEQDLVLIGPKNKLVYQQVDIEESDNIKYLGYASKPELKYAYSNADLFAFPSMYEGFGLPPLEAAACGTPVVTSDVTSLPEVMGDAAEFVDPEDVEDIERGLSVVTDSKRCEELRERGKERAATFSWDKTAKTLSDIFRRVAE